MASKKKVHVHLVPTEEITLMDGSTFTAKYTIRTAILYKQKTGTSLNTEVARLAETPDEETILDVSCKVVWALIAHDDGAPSLDDMYDLLPVDQTALAEIINRAFTLINRSMPQQKGDGDNSGENPTKKANP